MIYGVLIKFNQNLIKKQDINEHKLLTINLLSVNKDQLIKPLPGVKEMSIIIIPTIPVKNKTKLQG